MKKLIVVVATIATLSCNKGEEMQVQDITLENVEPSEKQTEEEFMEDQIVTDSTPTQRTTSLQTPTAKADWTKRIIKTANVELEVKDYHGFNNAVHHTLQNYGAYIAQEQQVETDVQITNQLSIKVPVEQFEGLLNYLSADKRNKVLQKEIGSSDVTAEFVDTRSRVETKKQVRAKYYELLKHAKKMDEVLQVQSEINSITEDIEAASGRVQYLSHQSLYSTINLHYFQVLGAAKIDNNTTPGFLTRLADALKGGASFVGNIVITLVYLWPLLIVGLAALLIIKRSGLLKAKPIQNNRNVKV